MTNREVAKVLYDIAVYLEMQGEQFKPRAYEKVAETVEGLDEELSVLYKKGGMKALQEIPGVGVAIAERIEELLRTGSSSYYKELKKEVPVDLDSFRGIEGLGPKSILKLYKSLKIKNAVDLEKAIHAGKIRRLAGFGEKSEENLLKGIAFTKKSIGRFTLGSVLPKAQEIEARLKGLSGVQEIIIAGSIRRRKELVGDVDILIVAKNPGAVMDYFVKMPEIGRVYAHGKTKSAIQLQSGLDVDLRVVPEDSYGAALNYFSGSKEHNIALRELAIKKGYTLNEYGLFKGARQIAGKTEEDLYKKLGLVYIPPELRENAGEIEAARNNTLPKLIEYNALYGDLQIQTKWSDGANSIYEMAVAGAKLGLEYIVITDHTKRLTVANGLDEKRIQAQWKEIDEVNKKIKRTYPKFKVLKGTECDVLKDGTLDLPDSVLSKLDVVGVSVHSYFTLSREEQTKRIIRAISNPHVDVLFHPTGRVLKKREPYDIDIDAIIGVAKKTGTVMEIDAYPDRLDLKNEHVRKCVQKGVRMSIDSDAHAVTHMPYLEYGIGEARRGWAERKDIVNAWPLEKMLSFLKK